jgi:DDE superfamily endonuclease
MNCVVAQHPGKEIHVILDNLSTHKPERDVWLRRHPNVHLHDTPTHASWLSQVEIWVSILAGKSLNRGSFRSVRELIDHIDGFIASDNDTARPFVSTKSIVHQTRLKPPFAD